MYCNRICVSVAPQSSSNQVPVTVGVSRSHTIRHRSVRTSLNEWSACRRGRYLHNTQQTKDMNEYALSWIRNCSSRNQATADLRLKPHGQRDRLL